MWVKRPTQQQMSDIVAGLGMTMSQERIGEFVALTESNFVA